MPTHDWTRVEAGIFHDFHTVWIGAIRNSLNEGLLPSGYYALAEQHAGKMISDVLTLHTAETAPDELPPLPPDTGGIAVAEAPPSVRIKQVVEARSLVRRRTLAIRHVSGHRLIALLEIVSPANKDREENVSEFVNKAVSTLRRGIHVLLVDLFPPGRHDPQGIHGEILQQLQPDADPYELPDEEPLSLASYAAGPDIEIYLEHLAAGAPLPPMPLFLRPDRYVNVPLEETYQSTWRGVPAFWRDVLTAESP